MSEIKNAVVERFRDICMDRGIAVNELANRAGITPSTVYSLFDSKRKNVYIKTIKILCDGLNISLAEFFDADIFDDLEQEIK